MVNRVTGPGRPAVPAGRAISTPAAPAGQFSVTPETAAAEPPPPAAGVTLAAMLALQEAQSGALQNQAARRQGFALLAALSDLQKDLLAPLGSDETALATLTRLAGEPPQTADPALATLLDAIRLRAKIELLRRGVEIP